MSQLCQGLNCLQIAPLSEQFVMKLLTGRARLEGLGLRGERQTRSEVKAERTESTWLRPLLRKTHVWGVRSNWSAVSQEDWTPATLNLSLRLLITFSPLSHLLTHFEGTKRLSTLDLSLNVVQYFTGSLYFVLVLASVLTVLAPALIDWKVHKQRQGEEAAQNTSYFFQ